MQWTKEKPSKSGYYWVKQSPDYYPCPQKIIVYISDTGIKTETVTASCNPGSSFKEFTHFMGPIEKPKNPIDDYAKYIVNRFKEAGLTPQYVRIKIGKILFEGINAILKKDTEVFDISIINNKQIWNWNTTSCEEYLDEIIDSNIKLSLDHINFLKENAKKLSVNK